MGLLASSIYIKDKHWEREKYDPKTGKIPRLDSYDDTIAQRIIFVNRVIEFFLFLILVSVTTILGAYVAFYLEMERAQRFKKCNVKDDCPDSSKYLCSSSFEYNGQKFDFKGSRRCVYKSRQGDRCPPNLELDDRGVKCITTDKSKVSPFDDTGDECENSDDCKDNEVNKTCHNGRCVSGEKCNKNSSCDQSREICVDGFCKEIPDCQDDTTAEWCDVGNGEICTVDGCTAAEEEEEEETDPPDTSDPECEGDDDCTGESEGRCRLSDNTCVECLADDDCENGKCNSDTNECESSGDSMDPALFWFLVIGIPILAVLLAVGIYWLRQWWKNRSKTTEKEKTEETKQIERIEPTKKVETLEKTKPVKLMEWPEEGGKPPKKENVIGKAFGRNLDDVIRDFERGYTLENTRTTGGDIYKEKAGRFLDHLKENGYKHGVELGKRELDALETHMKDVVEDGETGYEELVAHFKGKEHTPKKRKPFEVNNALRILKNTDRVKWHNWSEDSRPEGVLEESKV